VSRRSTAGLVAGLALPASVLVSSVVAAPGWAQSPSPAPSVSAAALAASVLPLTGEVLDLSLEVEPLELQETEAGITTVTLSADVLFDFGEATLTPEATTRIAEIARELPRGAPGPVRIEGHTDAIGADNDNLTLSEQRAAAVRDALVAGVPGLATTVAGLGEAQPVAPDEVGGEDAPENRAKNRRVTISYG